MFFKNKQENFAKIFFHDLKNKLLSVKLNLTLVKKKLSKESEFNLKIIERIEYNLEESIDLIKGYLDLEKYKKTKFIKHTKTSLNKIIEKILKSLETNIEKKNISVSFSKPSEAEVKINSEWLYKALYNILHNAVKYNKEHGFIQITITKTKSGFIIKVKDSGKGMSEEEKEQIFKKFYSTDSKHGHGIGLNMTKTIIESFGGKIKIESKLNEGSTFYIYIPSVAKQIKIKTLSMAFAAFLITGFFIINYYLCLIPQNIQTIVSKNTKIYKFENKITVISGLNDTVKIKAYKNLFGTKTVNKIYLKKGDVYINTFGEKLTLITPKGSFHNLGTKFETLAYSNVASSVYEGKIKTSKYVVNTNEGIIISKKIKTKPLPKPVEYIKILHKKDKIDIFWSSEYKNFKIVLSKDKNFVNKPLITILSSKNQISLNNLNDGLWYIKIRAMDDNLLSKSKTKSFIALLDYNKAKEAYSKKNLYFATEYLNKSLKYINKASAKPYILYANILYEKNKLNNALKYINEALKIKKDSNSLILKAKILFKLKKFQKIPNILKNIKNEEAKIILAKTYLKLGNKKIAKKIIYQILEINPNNKEVQKLIKKINIKIF